MIRFIFIVLAFFLVFSSSVFAGEHFFTVQSIDTMKLSRDMARQEKGNPQYDAEIETEIKNIAETGATHVGLGTPYDDEFIPYLKRWVAMARKYKLKVWFRGNFSGWEGWFDYPKISKINHTNMLSRFIKTNPTLFEFGDVFTSCPECENGGTGDPRKTKDTYGFRKFIMTENAVAQDEFAKQHKKITTNYYSMNGDVARLIMNPDMTRKMGGVMTVDHYVITPDVLDMDTTNMATRSGGKVVLGEFGAPIPDINGKMTEDEQATWMEQTLQKIIKSDNVVAVNYWTNKESSTSIWNDDNSPRKAVSILTKYFSPNVIIGTVTDDLEIPLTDVVVKTKFNKVLSKDGTYSLPTIYDSIEVYYSKLGYMGLVKTVPITNKIRVENVVLARVNKKEWPNLFELLKVYMRKIIKI